MAQDRSFDTVPLVEIQDAQLKEALYSFGREAKQLGLITLESPNFVRVGMDCEEDGGMSWNFTVGDGYRELFFDLNLSQESKDVTNDGSFYSILSCLNDHPFIACHSYEDCLFLFHKSGDSAYLSFSSNNIILRYSDYQGLPVFMVDTLYSHKLEYILSTCQMNGAVVESSIRDSIIRTLKIDGIRRTLKEWWDMKDVNMCKVKQLLYYPQEDDKILYQDDQLTVYLVKSLPTAITTVGAAETGFSPHADDASISP